MIRSEEFWSSEAVGSKVKTPLEFTVSLLRATGAELADLPGLVIPGARNELGALPARGSGMSGSMGVASRPRRLPGALVALRDLGQPLYGAQPPTGYEDRAAAWVSTGALLQRFRFGFAVAADRLPGVQLDVPVPPRHQPTEAYLAELGRGLIGRLPSPVTLEAVQAQLELPPEELEELGLPPRFARSPEARSRLALAWMAASSEFQRK
jgi:hypothetical protein